MSTNYQGGQTLAAAVTRAEKRPRNDLSVNELQALAEWDQWDQWDDGTEWTDITHPGPET